MGSTWYGIRIRMLEDEQIRQRKVIEALLNVLDESPAVNNPDSPRPGPARDRLTGAVRRLGEARDVFGG